MDTRIGVVSSASGGSSCSHCPSTWLVHVPLLLPVVHVNNKSKVLSCLCAPQDPVRSYSLLSHLFLLLLKPENGQRYYMRQGMASFAASTVFTPPTCSPDRGRCHHCVRVDAAAVAIIMSNILLDAVARLQPELPQSLAMHSALNHVAKLFANMLRIRLPDANTNRKREANIFQFDFHLHLEFFLHENYFRLAVIYRILLRRNASCRTSTATVAATFVSLTAMQSLHQFIDQLDRVRSVCARGLLNKRTALCPIWALAQSLQNVRRAVIQGEHQICRTSVSQIKSPAN